MTNILNIISLQTNPNGWEKNILILFFWQKNHQLQSSVHESKELNFSWKIHEEIIEGTSSSPIISFRLDFAWAASWCAALSPSLPPSLGVKEIVIFAEHTLYFFQELSIGCPPTWFSWRYLVNDILHHPQMQLLDTLFPYKRK